MHPSHLRLQARTLVLAKHQGLTGDILASVLAGNLSQPDCMFLPRIAVHLAEGGVAWSEGQQDDSEAGWVHLAEGLLQAVLGVGVLELDGADAAQVVQVAAQLLRAARHLRPLRLAAQLLRLRRGSPSRLRLLHDAALPFQHAHPVASASWARRRHCRCGLTCHCTLVQERSSCGAVAGWCCSPDHTGCSADSCAGAGSAGSPGRTHHAAGPRCGGEQAAGCSNAPAPVSSPPITRRLQQGMTCIAHRVWHATRRVMQCMTEEHPPADVRQCATVLVCQ